MLEDTEMQEVLTDLAWSVHTAMVLLEKDYPAEASSLRQKLIRAEKFLKRRAN